MESAETVTVSLTPAGAGASIFGAPSTPSNGSLSIDDNDASAVTISIAADAATVAESVASVTFTVTAQGAATAAAISVPFTVSGDATIGTPTASPVSIPMGAQNAARTATITVPLDETDTLIDDMETVTVTLGALPTVAGLTVRMGATSATTTVNDDGDDTSARTLTVTGPATVTEGTAGTFNIGITGMAFSSPTAVTWTVTHGDTVAADFAAVTGSVTFPTQSSFAITPTDDNFVESAESFTVQLSVADATADSGTAFGAAAMVMVTDNDTAGLVITPDPLSVPEKGMADYTVRLATQPVDNTATVTVTVSGGGGDTAIDAVSDMLMFTAMNWNTPQTVTVTAAEDAMVGNTVTLMHAVSGMDEYNGITAVDLTVNIVARPTTQATHDLLLPEVTRAVVGQQMQAIAGRVGTINGGGVGDSASFRERGFPGFAGAAAAHLQSFAGDADVGDGVDAKELLRGLEFVMPLSAGASHGDGYGVGVGDIAFWGGSDYRDFSGEDGDDDWDGSVLGLHFGVDGRVRAHLHAGLMVSYNDAESEYTRISDGTTDKGDYELDMTSVSPFLNWKLNGGNAWASVTYGSGEVEVKPDDGEASVNDVNMTGVAAGGSRRLLEQNGRELSLRADAFIAESEVEGDNDNATAGIDDDLDVDANRLRVALAWNYPQRFSDGRLTPAFDLGLRHDGGDGRTGTGLELGGALKFYAPAVGLTLEGNARALLGHTGDHRAWGIGGLMRVESGADGQGLAVTVAPSYGGDFGGGYGGGSLAAGGYGGDGSVVGDGSRGLWNRNAATAADSAEPIARLNAEVGYGLPAAGLIRAFGFADSAGAFGDGMLTPYSALRVGDASRDYRLGVRWSTGPRIDLDLSARHINADSTDNAVTLEGRLRF